MATAATIVGVALGQVGVHEGKSGGHWDNVQIYSPNVTGLEWSQGQPWCATFVSWCAEAAGVKSLYPVTASCSVGVRWFKDRGRWSDYPAVGAQVFYGVGGSAHTGIVIGFDRDSITTIEGNTNTSGSAEGDGVYQKTRQRRDPYVYGYGVPAYAGLLSADPRWGGSSSGNIQATAPATPVVYLSRLVQAAKTDPSAAQGHQTYAAGVKIVEKALKNEGLLGVTYSADGSFGSTTVTAYARWQYELGYRGNDANGIPGMASLSALGKMHGFKVVS